MGACQARTGAVCKYHYYLASSATFGSLNFLCHVHSFINQESAARKKCVSAFYQIYNCYVIILDSSVYMLLTTGRNQKREIILESRLGHKVHHRYSLTTSRISELKGQLQKSDL